MTSKKDEIGIELSPTIEKLVQADYRPEKIQEELQNCLKSSVQFKYDLLDEDAENPEELLNKNWEDFQIFSYQEIGDMIGVTKQRVQQIASSNGLEKA